MGVRWQNSIRICGAHSRSRPAPSERHRATGPRPPVSVDPVCDSQMLRSLLPRVRNTMMKACARRLSLREALRPRLRLVLLS